MTDPKKGERWHCSKTGRTVRVMADPVEGYIMARFKGAIPFVLHRNDWPKRFSALEPLTKASDQRR